MITTAIIILAIIIYFISISIYANAMMSPFKKLLIVAKDVPELRKTTIGISDLFALAVLSQYPMVVAIGSGMSLRKDEVGFGLLIATLSLAVGGAIWVFGIRVLNLIEVRVSTARLAYLLLILPVSVIGGFFSVPLICFCGASFFDKELNTLACFGVLVAFVMITKITYETAQWVSRQSELGKLTRGHSSRK